MMLAHRVDWKQVIRNLRLERIAEEAMILGSKKSWPKLKTSFGPQPSVDRKQPLKTLPWPKGLLPYSQGEPSRWSQAWGKMDREFPEGQSRV